jgi:flagellum-specific peptidoglycan hydrolase FlgJ
VHTLPLPKVTRQQIQFLLRVAPPALQSEREYGIPACITLAQAILESATPRFGWGSSRQFRLANNPFGIKYCHFGNRKTGDGAPETPVSPDPNPGSRSEDYGHFDVAAWEFIHGQKKEVFAQFQCFPDLAQAFKAHARLLLSPRYRPAYEERHNWKEFAERLGPKKSERDVDHCGYSTNPSYSAQLTTLVNTYRLNDPRALEWLSTGKDPGPVLAELLQ